MKQTLKRFTLLAMAFCISLVSFAQVTTSGISGKILDASGESLTGASIVAVHIPSGTKYATVVNSKGYYTLLGLRVGGPYKVTVSFIGYQTKEFTDISLALGDTYKLNAKLSEETMSLESAVVSVSRSSVFNDKKMGASESFDNAKIQNTASISRSIYDVAKLNPLAVKTSGGMSIAGSNNKYNSFQLDGTVSNDVFGLSGSGTNGGQTGSNPISMEAIDEIQVVVAPFDVRQSGFVGGGINAVTKSGTNEFHGSAYGYYNNQDFYGKTPGKKGRDYSDERTSLTDQYSSTYGITVGGPIIKDKLFFFLNYEGTNDSYPTAAIPGDSDSKVSLDSVDAVINFVKENYPDADLGGYESKDVITKSNKLLVRFDYNINKNNKLMFRYSLLDAQKDNGFGSSLKSVTLNNTGYTMNNTTHNLVAELNSNIGDNMYNTLRVGYTYVDDHRETPDANISNVQIKYFPDSDDGTGATLNFGLENFSQHNSLTQNVFTIEDNLSLYKGSHTITLGTHNEFFNMKNVFVAYNAGSYVYKGIDDFYAGNIDSYRYQYVNDEYKNADGEWGPTIKAGQLGFYAQDEWAASENLNLTYGVRVDVPFYTSDPMTNDAFNTSNVATTNDVETGVNPKSTPLIAPRIGFRWTPMASDKSFLVRGGVGMFTGRIPFVWISNIYTNAGLAMGGTSFYSGQQAEKEAAGFQNSLDPTKQFEDPGLSEVDVIDKDYKFPQVLRVNLAVEKNLPWGIHGTLEGLFSKTYNNILYENINYETNGDWEGMLAPDRPQWSKVNSGYTEVIKLGNTNKGYNVNLTAKFTKDFHNGFDVMAAYTWGKAESVNDGTSSQAYSSWKYNITYYGDKDHEVRPSSFDIRNRIIASVNWHKDYGKMGTEISLFYQGHSGGPYSVAVYGFSDDGRKGNDAAYMPSYDDIWGENPSSALTHNDEYLNFQEWINNNPDVADYYGKLMPRNCMRKPWEHHIDLHVAQNFYLNVRGKKHTLQINADIENLTNMFNHEWGNYYTPYNGYSVSPVSVSTGYKSYSIYDTSDMIGVSNISSRWHGQIGIKYIF